jgi:hypothetical protein
MAIMVLFLGLMMVGMGGWWGTVTDWVNWTAGNFTLNPVEMALLGMVPFLGVALLIAGIYIAIRGKDEKEGGTGL